MAGGGGKVAETIYNVTTLTFDDPIPAGSDSYAERQMPFLNRSNISFANAKIGSLQLRDDDPDFDDTLVVQKDSTGQTLVNDTTLGTHTVEAGQTMSFFYGTFIEQLDADGVGTGHLFRIQFPMVGYLENGSPVFSYLGLGHSVIMMPVTKNGVTPVFDQNAPYRFHSKSLSGSNAANTNTIPYAPQDNAPCFTTGTLIDTDAGPRRIETLRPGDHIRTRDHGLRRLFWIGCKALDARDLDRSPNLLPIRIAAGALAPQTPTLDLVVSPQHRVLVRQQGHLRLVAAKHLLGMPGITIDRDERGVGYWHMLFDGHEIVRSNGAWTESLYTGPEALKAVTPAARREILQLFPELACPDRLRGSVPAHPFMSGREARQLVSDTVGSVI